MKRFVAALLVLVSPAVFAHTGHPVEGLLSGWVHPFMGLDHLLAMLSVGLWAAFIARDLRQCGYLPLAFIAFMAAGGALGASGFSLPVADSAIALSVLLLGAFVCAMARVSLPLAMALVALFAAFHGFAHGAEMQNGVDFTGYAAGFSAATAVLHGAGIVLGRLLVRIPALYRATGMVIGATGFVLLSQSV
ncbi:HupE/UreJ family protein [Candidatus Methylospira mobilis]|nr:HupE/UreJ family protein [Candidatus Methylospira mobilis]WNV05630.1 HupE/UreJ family protein [Candidatus Methylospira mobilis]